MQPFHFHVQKGSALCVFSSTLETMVILSNVLPVDELEEMARDAVIILEALQRLEGNDAVDAIGDAMNSHLEQVRSRRTHARQAPEIQPSMVPVV